MLNLILYLRNLDLQLVARRAVDLSLFLLLVSCIQFGFECCHQRMVTAMKVSEAGVEVFGLLLEVQVHFHFCFGYFDLLRVGIRRQG